MTEEIKVFPSGKGTQKKNFFKIPAYVKATLGGAAAKATHIKKDGALFSPQVAKISKKLEKLFVFGTAKNKIKPYLSFATHIMKNAQKGHDVSKENTVSPIKINMSMGGR